MPLADNRNMMDLIKDGVFYLNSGRVIKLAEDILKGLQHLLKNKICHCDIKPSNILMIEFNSFSISDLGSWQ